jgi:hypothetical protein
MSGWRYEDVEALPLDVYEVLVEMVKEEAAKATQHADG